MQVQGLQLGADAKSLDEVITAYNALLQNNELQQLDIKLALAQDQLKATTNELESVASYTLELGAIHQQNRAIITSVAKAFANERQASVTRDERFAAFTQSTQAAFSDVTEALADIDQANLVRDQTFTAFAANTETAFADTTRLISNLDSAMATQRQDLVAKIEQDDTSTLASAISYTRAAVGYCIDPQGNLTSETDATLCVAAGHSWVDGPLAEFIRKLQIESANGDTASISDIRQAFETQDGRLIARGGFLINNQGRATGVVGLNDGQIGNLDLVGDVIRQGVQIGDTFIPTSFIDNRDPANPVHVFRGRLELGDFVVESESDIRGLDGNDGQNGLPGPPGRTYYTWIKYADDAQGNGLSDSPGGKAYIGVAYNKLSHLESNNPNDYAWSKIKGDKGNQGIPGDKGEDGQTFYTWVAYSDNANGSNLYQTPRDSTQYIGIAHNKTTAAESTNPAHYHWSKIKGDDGTDGIPGDKGEDGQTFYTWVAYSDSANGANMYQVPTSNTQYMGIAVNKLTSTESTNPAEYTWVKFKGADGTDGSPGEKGDKGDKGDSGTNGQNGARGAGRFVSSTSTGNWSDALAHAACGGRAVVHDVVTLYKQSDPSIQHTKHWTGTAWHDFALHIHGDQLVDGTVIAHELAAATGTFSGRLLVSASNTSADVINVSASRSGRAAIIANLGNSTLSTALVLGSNSGNGLEVSGAKHAIRAIGNGGNHNVIEVRANNSGATALWTPLKVYAANGFKPFTGVHEGLLSKSIQLTPGDIVCDDVLVNMSDISNAIFEMVPSTKSAQRNVRGVFVTRRALTNEHLPAGLNGFNGSLKFNEYKHSHDTIEFNALGEGLLNVCGQGGDIEAGDYLCSSDIAGKAMRQADQDFERPFTIAQARHSVTFTSSTQIKKIAVIYLRG